MKPLAVLLALVALPALGDEPRRVLGLDEALATARAQQPQLRQAHASTEQAQAQADVAKSGLLPQIGGTGAYQRATGNFVLRPGSLPNSINTRNVNASWDTAPFYTFGLSATQLLWDFRATSSTWRAGQASAASQAATERATLLQVLTSVRNAFFQARAARGLVTVAVDTLANRERHLGQVEAFVEVGTQPEIALAQARADRANAQYQLITAQNGYETTKAQLNQAMGVEGPTDYDVSDEMLPPMLGEDQDTQALLDEALAARPEMAAAAEAVRAQELLVKANRAEYLPTVSASTGFTDAGTQVSNLVWNWNAALNVSVPIFRGGQTGAQVQVARWQLEGLKAQADILRQQIRLDVDQARLAVRAAKAALSSADDALVNAREQLRLAEGRYETGVGNIIELDDAQVALTSASQQKVQAEYNLASARAQLLRAVGRS